METGGVFGRDKVGERKIIQVQITFDSVNLVETNNPTLIGNFTIFLEKALEAVIDVPEFVDPMAGIVY